MSNISKLVSVWNIINELVEDTGLGDVKMQDTWIRWAVKADREVGAFHHYSYRRKKIKICNCEITLPCDIIALLPGTAITENDDCSDACISETDPVFYADDSARFYSGLAPGKGIAFVVTGGGAPNPCFYNYRLENNKLKFNSSSFNDKYVVVRYLGYEEDCNGFPLIRESNSDACNYFIQLKMAEKARWSKGVFHVQNHELRDIRKMYSFHVAKARSEAGSPTEEEYRSMKIMRNSPLLGIANAHWVGQDKYWR